VPALRTPDPLEAARRRGTWGAIGVIVLSLLVGQLPPSAQEGVATALRVSVLRPFIALQESLVRARVRAGSVVALQARLDSLQAVLLTSATLAEENRRLRDLLEISPRIGPGWQGARALRSGTEATGGLFMLDAGSNDGVRVWSPVVAASGLVGVVREVAAASATAMDWSHPDFRVAAMNDAGTVFGIAQPQPGLLGGRSQLYLGGTPFSASLDAGTTIVTSGVGGVFPRGIPIGRISGVAEVQEGWQRAYWIEPFAEPEDAVQVLVATTDSMTVLQWPAFAVGTSRERELALGEAQDSVATLAQRVRAAEEQLQALQDSLAELRGRGAAVRR
jgi:cell shape-determining protein MreC